MSIKVATSYALRAISHPEAIKHQLLREMSNLDVKGTIIISEEGINLTIAGHSENIDAACLQIQTILNAKMHFQLTTSNFIPFRKLKVKFKQELVSFRDNNKRTCRKDAFLPKESRGQHLAPDQWDALLNDKNTKVIDTRNHYEYAIGHFVNAINPKTENFSQLTEWLKKNISPDEKDQPIAMYCTGGIRCEKSTAYMKKLGFSKVYHLQGGIINYMEQRKNQKSKWLGNLFIFDDRIALDHNLNSVRSHATPSQ